MIVVVVVIAGKEPLAHPCDVVGGHSRVHQIVGVAIPSRDELRAIHWHGIFQLRINSGVGIVVVDMHGRLHDIVSLCLIQLAGFEGQLALLFFAILPVVGSRMPFKLSFSHEFGLGGTAIPKTSGCARAEAEIIVDLVLLDLQLKVVDKTRQKS